MPKEVHDLFDSLETLLESNLHEMNDLGVQTASTDGGSLLDCLENILGKANGER